VVSALRVVQWTTGIVGTSALQAILDDPRLELVGVYAHNPSKVGRDAGELAGVAVAGVRATDDVDALIALHPDCVVYMPQWPDITELERILAAGINIVTTARLVSGNHYPDNAGVRLQRAALDGGASLFGTGMNPMHVPTVALASTAMCRSVRHIAITESVDCAMYGAAETWQAYGFGTRLEPDRLQAELSEAEPDYRETLDLIAAGVGASLDDYHLEVEYAVAVEDRDLGFMQIAKGTVSALDAHWRGLVDGRPFVDLRTTWKLGGIFGFRDDPDFPVTFGYDIAISGEPNVRLNLRFRPDDFEHFDIGTTTAMPAVNAIPAVCAAPSGVLAPTDLQLVTARHVPVTTSDT
jgi:2,4-diaminopentanoate dehydrogenase